MGSAELTLWARVDGLDPDAVATALWEDRTLVKTWAMRGTLHLLPAAELGLWQAGWAPTATTSSRSGCAPSASREEQLLELIDAVARRARRRELTREELADAVVGPHGQRGAGEKLRQSWGAYLKPAAFQGRLCFAPCDGQKVRFTRPDVGSAAVERPDPEEALREIARRYLAAHGPATREDVAPLVGDHPGGGGKLLRSLEDAVEVEVDGAPMWMLAADAAEAASAGRRGRRPAPPGLRPVRDRRHQARRALPPDGSATASTARRAGSRR